MTSQGRLPREGAYRRMSLFKPSGRRQRPQLLEELELIEVQVL